MPNDFSREGILARPEVPERSLVFFDEIDSTNNYAKRFVKLGYTDGTAIVADHQTAGRGRLGRSFYSPAGTGIYFTLIRSMNTIGANNLLRQTPAAAVAAIEAIDAVTGADSQIKWVNDIYVDGKKAAGILTESIASREGGPFDTVLIGVGFNCTTREFPEDIKDTAGAISRLDVDRNQMTAVFWKRLLYWSDHADSPEMIQKYREKSLVLGRPVSFELGGMLFHGTAEDIDAYGHLNVRLEDGSIRSLDSGEISLESWK